MEIQNLDEETKKILKHCKILFIQMTILICKKQT